MRDKGVDWRWRNEKRKSSTLAPETYRGQALRRIRYLHTASKVVEDLPQLVIASLYLVHTNVFGGSADDAAAAAAAGDDAAGRGAIGAWAPPRRCSAPRRRCRC